MMETQLSNGIRVIFQPLEGFAATLYWWNQVGSIDEGKGQEGFAHFLEHMLFKDAGAKDSGKASTGQIARSIESLGGEINAYTSFEQTVYHVTCAEEHFEKVIDQFGTMARPQKFLKSDFDREREVIFEEIRRSEDSPGRQHMQKLFKMTYPHHPYGRPVIGYKKSLEKSTTQKLETFYRDSYRTDRMGLIVVGPLDDAKRRERILAILEKRFGERVIPRSRKSMAADNKKSQRSLKLSDGVAFDTLPFAVTSPALLISFRCPELVHEDIPALDFLSGIMGMGESSRLYQKLFYEKSLVTEISCGLYVPRDPGMIYVSADLDGLDKVEQTVQAIVDEFENVKLEGPTQEEMERVLVNAESERTYATQTVDSMAGRLGFLHFVLGNPDFDEQFLNQLKNLQAEDLKRIAAKYFSAENMNAVLLCPKDQALPDVKPLASYSKKVLRKSKPAQVAKKRSDEHRAPLSLDLIERPSGLKIVHVFRPHSKVLGLQACMEGGLRYEKERWGAGFMMAQAWTKGTKKQNARQISGKVEGMAASLDGYAGRNSLGLEMTCLAKDWRELGHLFAEVLLTPVFPADEVVHARRVALDLLKSQQDHSSSLVQKLFLETLYENHPYGRQVAGTIQKVEDINSLILSDCHHEWVQLNRMVLAISGPISRHEVLEFADTLESLEDKAVARPVPFHLDLRNEEKLRAPRWAEKSMGREQVHTLVGGLGTTVKNEDRYAARVLQTILGGQSGRLFIELREKRSLAYSVGPMNFEGFEPGYLATYIASGPEKKEEAIKGIQKVLEQLASKGPQEKEMKRAVEFYLGRRAMGLQSDSSIASAFGLKTLFGEDPRNYTEVDEVLKSLTPAHIKAVCKKYLLEPFMVTASVG